MLEGLAEHHASCGLVGGCGPGRGKMYARCIYRVFSGECGDDAAAVVVPWAAVANLCQTHTRGTHGAGQLQLGNCKLVDEIMHRDTHVGQLCQHIAAHGLT